MSYSRQQLYALGEPLGSSATVKIGGKVIYGGGGSSSTPSTTTTISDIPDWAKGYAQETLAKGQALSSQPYQLYGGERIAGFSPLQLQAQQSIAGMGPAGQVGEASDIASLAGARAFQAGQYQPGQYTGGTFTPGAAGFYMSPFIEQAMAPQLREAQRSSDILGTQQAGQAVQAGAFGGSRAGLLEAERQRNLATQMGDIRARGYQSAYEQAANQFNADMQRRMQAQQLGEQSRQFGAGLGIQGLSTALQAAGQLGSLGQTQFGQQKDVLGMQSAAGAEQQALRQQGLSQAYQDFMEQQNYPYRQLGFMSDMIRGLPLGQQSSQQVYAAQPPLMSQLAGLGMGAYGLSRLAKKDGGVVGMAEGGYTEISDKVLADPTKYSEEQIRKSVKNGVLDPETAQIALAQIARAKKAAAGIDMLPSGLPTQSYAPGGIVAFDDGGEARVNVRKAPSMISDKEEQELIAEYLADKGRLQAALMRREGMPAMAQFRASQPLGDGELSFGAAGTPRELQALTAGYSRPFAEGVLGLNATVPMRNPRSSQFGVSYSRQFKEGGEVPRFQVGGQPSTPFGRWWESAVSSTERSEKTNALRGALEAEYGASAGVLGLFRPQTDVERETARKVYDLLPSLSLEQMQDLKTQGPAKFLQSREFEARRSRLEPSTSQAAAIAGGALPGVAQAGVVPPASIGDPTAGYGGIGQRPTDIQDLIRQSEEAGAKARTAVPSIGLPALTPARYKQLTAQVMPKGEEAYRDALFPQVQELQGAQALAAGERFRASEDISDRMDKLRTAQEARYKSKEKDIETDRDRTVGIAFLEAAQAMVQPGQSFLQGLARSGAAGGKRYMEDKERLDKRADELSDAILRLDEARVGDVRERAKAKGELDQALLNSRSEMIKYQQTVLNKNEATATRTVDAMLKRETDVANQQILNEKLRLDAEQGAARNVLAAAGVNAQLENIRKEPNELATLRAVMADPKLMEAYRAMHPDKKNVMDHYVEWIKGAGPNIQMLPPEQRVAAFLAEMSVLRGPSAVRSSSSPTGTVVNQPAR